MVIELIVCALVTQPPQHFVLHNGRVTIRTEDVRGYRAYPDIQGEDCVQLLFLGGFTLYVKRTPELEDAIRRR